MPSNRYSNPPRVIGAPRARAQTIRALTAGRHWLGYPKKNGARTGPVVSCAVRSMWVHRSWNDGFRMRLRLGRRDGSDGVARRDVPDEVIHEARIDRRAKTGRRVPADTGGESDDIDRVVQRVELKRRVGAVDDVVERGWIRLVHPADLVDGRVEESQRLSRLLVRDRGDRGPLRRAGTGAAEAIDRRPVRPECSGRSVRHAVPPRCRRRRAPRAASRRGWCSSGTAVRRTGR